jgi:hypothetical protein
VFWLQSLGDAAYFGSNTRTWEKPLPLRTQDRRAKGAQDTAQQNSPADYHTQKSYGNTQSAINVDLLNLQHFRSNQTYA